MKKIFSFLLLLAIWISQSGFLVIGHRGDPINFPEETFQSFDSAFQNGANYVELDLHLSLDKQLIVSHDRNLARVTGTDAIVSQKTTAELQQLHQSNGESIHTLEEVFTHYQNQPDAKFLIETKKTKKNNPKDMEEILIALIKKYHMEDRVMLQSFNAKSLATLHKAFPKISTILIINSLADLNFEVLKDINGVNISSKLISDNLISKLHKLGLKVYVWDQMNEDEKQWNWVVNLPIDGVITNYALTGYQYQLAKSGSETFTVDKRAIVASTKQIPIYENPYQKVATDKFLPALSAINLTKGITINNQTFYQVSSKQFILGDNINLNLTQSDVSEYLNKEIINNQSDRISLHQDPSTLSPLTGKKLGFKQTAKIIGVNFNSQITWFQLENGWIKANDVLVMNLDPKKNPRHLTNILLINNPAIAIIPKQNNFFNNLFILSTQLSNINAKI